MNERKPLNHVGSIPLETKRLILRKTSISDAKQMFYNWASDPEVTKHLMWETHSDIEITKNVLADWDKKNENLDYYHWGIVLKENNQIIGTCGSFGIDEKNYKTEIGYCMSRSCWGKGYMTEAVSAMIDFLLNTVGANRIIARFDPINIGSGRVMEKSGMKFEGILRQDSYCEKRGYYDLVLYSILKDEYEKDAPYKRNAM